MIRVFLLIGVLFGFLFADVDENVSNEVFLRLDTGGHTAKINDIIVTKSGDIITASDDKTIRVWDSKIGKEKRKILGQIGGGEDGKIYAIALSSNEKFLAVGGFFNNPNDVIRIYAYQSGKLLKVLRSHINVVDDLAFSRNGKYLISSSSDRTAKIWRVEDFTLQDIIKFHKKEVYAVGFIEKEGSPFTVTAGVDNKILLYNIQTKKIVKFHKLNYELQYLAISKNHIAVCGRSKKIQIYNYNLEPIKTIKSETKPEGLAYSPNGKKLISGENATPDNVNIYSVTQNYKKIQSFKKHTNLTRAVSFLDNEIAVSGGGNNYETYIWNIKTAQILKKIESEGYIVWSVGMKGDNIAWGNILDIKENNNAGHLQKSINLKKFQIDTLRRTNFNGIFTTYKNYKLSHRRGGNYGRVDGVLDIKRDGKTIASITRGLANGLSHNCYGFYKNYIVSGGVNGHLIIYTLEGKEIATLVGHIGAVWTIAIDGDILVSGSDDQTIRIWDLSKLKKNSEKLKINEKFVASLMTQYNISRESVIQQAKQKNMGELYLNFQILNPQLNLFISKTNEWIAWTNEGYFNASEKGMDFIYFHLNQGADKEAKAIPVERLYDHFFRPDLIQLKLKDEEAYQEKIKGLDFKIALRNPPPSIKFDTNISKTNDRNITLHYSIEESFTEDNRSGGIGLIRVYQEGKLIKTIGDGEVNASRAVADAMSEMEHKKHNEDNINKEKKSKSSIREKTSSNTKTVLNSIVQNQKEGNITIELIAGKNEITIEAFNKTNLVASKRDKIVIEANISKRTPKFYAIVAGVKDFQEENNLTYTEKDSDAINNLIDTKVRELFGKENVDITYLKGKEVTKENLLNAIKKVDKVAKLEDTVLFFISTHGQTSPKEEYKDELFLIPSNDRDDENWIEFTKTFEKIQKIKTLNQIFVIDACYSGNADSHVSAIYDTKASIFAKKSGVHMLLATTKGALAMEKNKLGHGIFTDSILKALDSNETDENNDSIISVIELSKRLKKPLDKEHEQYPVIRNVGRDVVLERVE